MANTRGRQVVLVLTNKSGGSVAAGDVVVFDTTTDESFTTTTTGRAELSVGIAQETIANNAVGRVLVSGYAALVNVPSSRTRGEYLETHTVVKQATGSATRRSGSFGQFAKTSTTPSAWLWGQTDQAATGVADQGTVTYFDFTTAAAPASPAAGKIRVYSKTGDTFAQKTSGGTETVFGAGGGSSGLVLITQQTASASATLDFTTAITSTYDEYRIEFINVLPATTNSRLWMRMSTDGGATYDAGAAVYTYAQWRYASTAGSAAAGGTASAIFLSTTDNVTNSATWGGLNGTATLFNPGSAASYKMVTYKTTNQDGVSGANLQAADGTGVYTSTTAVNAFRILYSAGNITSGTVRVYGLAK